ncbi:MAG TPA: phosphoribosylformylglycinamidine cyclo-ligase [Myxococcota bacterium]|nr:phosphoribosylformylglycinamidine cyclo-ligase [Myxococcota bacterium]HOC98606.1 phosphoribosylformylglycinamidine cyclo-ligase [Myxococcota bacterium]HPV03580.1 phosphoribosylformylglycinamidine cyclo-ligase [Myxococcota bacterium]
MTMQKLTYKQAGVDIDAGDEFASAIGRMVKSTITPEVVSGVGGFAAAVAPNMLGMKRPLLISGTDGVGTKLKLAFMTGIHNTIGIDLVAMCVNDVLTTGARPLFFLDYFASGHLEQKVSLQVIEGIVEGCRQAGCSLVGGETAELPGFYAAGEYDLAGFSVGIVDEPDLVDGRTCKPGDVLIGLPSSGVHSNGYSLVRHIIDTRKLDIHHVYEGFTRTLGEVLLTPTYIYADAVNALMAGPKPKAMAHITGGGIVGNLPRVFPQGVGAEVWMSEVPESPVFQFLQGKGTGYSVEDDEMMRVFNMGVGLIIVMAPEKADAAIEALRSVGRQPFVFGRLTAGSGEVVVK